VFPYVDVLRVLSVLVLLALFTIAIEVFAGYVKGGSRFPKTPRRMILPLLAALAAATLITATRADIGDASGVVAIVAAGTLLLIHFVFTCSVPACDRSGPTLSPEHRANILLLLTLAASCGGLAIWGERTEAAPAAMEHGVGLMKRCRRVHETVRDRCAPWKIPPQPRDFARAHQSAVERTRVRRVRRPFISVLRIGTGVADRQKSA
jgi:hypothetical protein